MSDDRMVPIAIVPPVLVDATGRPVVAEDLGACPRCGAKKDKRVQTSGFGRVRPVICGSCGYDQFPPEVV